MTEDVLDLFSRRDELDELLTDVLTIREKAVLVLRYGLDGKERPSKRNLAPLAVRSRQEIADVFGVTKEKILGVERHALRKLRREIEFRKLHHELQIPRRFECGRQAQDQLPVL